MADTRNKVWDPVAKANGLPTGQFTAEMTRGEARALATSLSGAAGKQQGTQRLELSIDKEGKEGTWSLQEDPEGKPVWVNSKTTEVKPAEGVQKAGTYEKTTGAAETALNYATSYLNEKHTGPGDEALMEKYFELAKPSVGFRMTGPQISMLTRAQSWINSIEAHVRHATVGTYFSDPQRREIVTAMTDLARAKGIKTGGGGGKVTYDGFDFPNQEAADAYKADKAAKSKQ